MSYLSLEFTPFTVLAQFYPPPRTFLKQDFFTSCTKIGFFNPPVPKWASLYHFCPEIAPLYRVFCPYIIHMYTFCMTPLEKIVRHIFRKTSVFFSKCSHNENFSQRFCKFFPKMSSRFFPVPKSGFFTPSTKIGIFTLYRNWDFYRNGIRA